VCAEQSDVTCTSGGGGGGVFYDTQDICRQHSRQHAARCANPPGTPAQWQVGSLARMSRGTPVWRQPEGPHTTPHTPCSLWWGWRYSVESASPVRRAPRSSFTAYPQSRVLPYLLVGAHGSASAQSRLQVPCAQGTCAVRTLLLAMGHRRVRTSTFRGETQQGMHHTAATTVQPTHDIRTRSVYGCSATWHNG
jgi:hypothetical protein